MPPKTALNVPAPAEVPKASLKSRKQELVRDTIWTAAIDLFAEKGFEETTIDDIVDAVGTSRRTFFRHFESKRDLMAQPVVSYGASLARAIQSSRPNSSPAELFRHVVLAVAQRTVSDPRMRKVLDIAARYPAAREAQLSRVAELQDQVAEAFRQRCRDEITAHVLAGSTLSALSLVCRIWFSTQSTDITSVVDLALGRLSAVVCSEQPRNRGTAPVRIPKSAPVR